MVPPGPPVSSRDDAAGREEQPAVTSSPLAVSAHADLDDRSSAAPRLPTPAVEEKEHVPSPAVSQPKASPREEERQEPSSPVAPAFAVGRGEEPTE